MKKILIILFILLPTLLLSQEIVFQREIYPFPITFYGVEPQFGFTDVSEYYHHDFGDVDNDGDFDIIIGTGFGQEYFAENVGTSEEADFQLITNQYVFPGEDDGINPPAFADIDNDNDLDIFIGFDNGYIVFFRNIGTPDSAAYELESENYLNYILTNRATPTFVDIDGDGDLDFFAGERGGYFYQIYYFRNEGTPDTADFVFVTDNFAGIVADYFTIPEFCDLDLDGDYDLFVGSTSGTIWYYENTGDSINYNFEYITDSNYLNLKCLYNFVTSGIIKGLLRFYPLDADPLKYFIHPMLGFGHETVGTRPLIGHLGPDGFNLIFQFIELF